MTPETVIRRTQRLTHTAALCLAVVLAAQSANAETGVTNVLNGTTLNVGGNYMVGTNGAFNALIVTNAGYFDVNGYSYVGNSATSSNNYATVTGTGSIWFNRSDLYLGYTGSFNQLTIADGGVARTLGFAFVGLLTGANSNAVLVTGPGSVWSSGGYLTVGLYGAGNQMTIANSGAVFSVEGYVGHDSTANNNSVLVTGPGSVWSNSGFVSVGLWGGQGNQMTITNSGAVLCAWGQIGVQSSFNSVFVGGTGSVWNAGSQLDVGSDSVWNQLLITDGGAVGSATSYIGKGNSAHANSVQVTGSGSVWSNYSSLYVGYSSSDNQVVIANSGTVVATNIVIGYNVSSYNYISVTGGNLYATNATSTGALDVRTGVLTLNSGTVVVDRLYLTNKANSVMTFSAGLLQSGGSSVSNGVAFTVGDGVQSATLDLLGGTHTFANGLKLNTNSSLIGNGGIFGNVTNFSIIAPGHSVGAISITGDLALMDTSELDFEIAGTGTNDHLDISGLLAAGGGLKLTLTDGYTGNAGDTFDLFNFGSISGAFSQTNLPTLAAGMEWNTGHLYTLGEIRIVPEPSTGALLALGMAALASRRVRNEKLRAPKELVP